MIRSTGNTTGERAHVDQHDFQFLYSSGDDGFVFMNSETYDQVSLSKDLVGDQAAYLPEGMKVTISFHEGVPVSMELPQKAILEVTDTEPTVQDQTTASSDKPAVLSNGVHTMESPFGAAQASEYTNDFDSSGFDHDVITFYDGPGQGPWSTGGLVVSNLVGSISGSGDPTATAREATAAAHETLIRLAVDSSPNKIAIVAVKGAYDHPGIHASTFDPSGFDHIAVAYYDEKSHSYKLAEMAPNSAELTDLGKDIAGRTGSVSLGSLVGSKNNPGDIEKLAFDYKEVAAAPVYLDQEQASKFLAAVLVETAPDKNYSFLSGWFLGQTCASSIAEAVRQTLDSHFANVDFVPLEGLTVFLKEMSAKYGLQLDTNLLDTAASANFNAVLPSAILKYFAEKSGVVFDSRSFVTGTYFGDSVDHAGGFSGGLAGEGPSEYHGGVAWLTPWSNVNAHPDYLLV